MADLSVLIRLHKHELDAKRRALGKLYTALSLLERERRELERNYEAEKKAADATGDIHFTFHNYSEEVARKKEEFERAERHLEHEITIAKDSMMETFAEMKKYEMTQEERERIEEEERAFKEARTLDDLGIESFRRREGEE